jgi:hypothetical protein
LSSTLSPSYLVRDIKKDSSIWIKTLDSQLSNFHWQQGYGAFSVSPSHVDALVGYIDNQEEHHKKESFKDQFRRLCQKYGLQLDEQYVWD